MGKKNPLKKLSKLELLELLAEQEREIQELKEQLEQKNQIIEQRALCMRHSGNIAEAALNLNGVFEAAQKAADQYLESVKALIAKNLEETGNVPDKIDGLGTMQQPMYGRDLKKLTTDQIIKDLNEHKTVQNSEEQEDRV